MCQLISWSACVLIYLMEEDNEAIEDLNLMRSISHSGGHPHDVERLRQTGRFTARERIKKLLDPDSFVEFEAFITHRNPDFNLHLHQHPGDGVVAGHGTLNGRPVHCFAQDFGVFGGSMGEMHAAKISRTIEMAERSRTPIIGIWDGGGQRAHDGVTSLAETGVLMDHLVQCSGRIPIFSLILGPVVGASALCAGISDFTIMSSQHGQLFLSSPLVTPEIVSKELSVTRCSNLDIESRLTIHFSSYNEIFTYSISGLIQRLVTPKIVSGRSVAVTNFASSNVRTTGDLVSPTR